jgi:Zn finger protein HypA/HybF involved in hydrogenase expression
MKVVALNRTLDQELLALSRGASLECLVCGEFVMRTDLGIVCPECGSVLEGRAAEALPIGVETG